MFCRMRRELITENAALRTALKVYTDNYGDECLSREARLDGLTQGVHGEPFKSSRQLINAKRRAAKFCGDFMELEAAKAKRAAERYVPTVKEINEYEDKYYADGLSDKARLEGITRLAQAFSYSQPERVDAIVRMLTEKVVLERGIEAFAAEPQILSMGPADYIFRDCVDKFTGNRLYEIMHSRPMVGCAEIDLAVDAVLTSPNSSDKLANCFFNGAIGEGGNPFAQKKDHAAVLYLPIGVTIVEEGKHSAFCGEYRRSGKLAPQRVYDITPLYSEIYFDGVFWRLISDESVVAAATCWEMGAVFEMKRPRCRRISIDDNLELNDSLFFKGAEFRPVQEK